MIRDCGPSRTLNVLKRLELGWYITAVCLVSHSTLALVSVFALVINFCLNISSGLIFQQKLQSLTSQRKTRCDMDFLSPSSFYLFRFFSSFCRLFPLCDRVSWSHPLVSVCEARRISLTVRTVINIICFLEEGQTLVYVFCLSNRYSLSSGLILGLASFNDGETERCKIHFFLCHWHMNVQVKLYMHHAQHIMLTFLPLQSITAITVTGLLLFLQSSEW